jgi:two-component system OmpR family sensor kinase
MSSNLKPAPKAAVNLRRRLLGLTIGLATATVILSGLAVFAIAARSLWRNLDASLIQIAKTEIASATDTGTLHVHETGTRTLTVSGVIGYEKFVWLENNQGRILAASANVRASRSISGIDEPKRRALRGETTFGNLEIDGRPARAVFTGFSNTDGTPAVGVVCIPSGIVYDVVTQIGEVIVLVGLVCIAAVTVIALLLTRMISAPIEGLAHQVSLLEPAAKDTPAQIDPPYVEMAPLTSAFNGLVGRVRILIAERESTIARQRRFVADTSHELRTPVANLQGTLEVALRRERTEEEYRKTLQTSLGEVHRLTRLVEDLLVLAKSDEAALDIRKSEVRVDELLRDALEACRTAGIHAQLDVPEGLAAHLDPIRVRQAVDNLLRNAFTYAASRAVLSGFLDGGDLVITVLNDGPPISPADTAAIFERFHRLDHSRARDTGGSGLGLAIVQAVAEGHGGTVSVESDSAGTRFVFRLPNTP